MNTPHLAMVAIPERAGAAVRWGTRTPAELAHEPARTASPPATAIAIYQRAADRDVEEPLRAQLLNTAARLLRSPSFKRCLVRRARPDPTASLWLLWETGHRLRAVEPAAVPDATNALLAMRHTVHASSFTPTLIHFTTATAVSDATVDAVLAAFSKQLAPLTSAGPTVGRGHRSPATLVIGAAPDAADQRAVLSFRESLLAEQWPDSQTVGRQLGSQGTGAESRISRERAAGTLFGVWAGRDRGGYRHPPFQFLPSGSVHPRLPELLDALARRPDLAPAADRSGWERAFWLYLPRGRLSVQALALRAAAPAQVRADPARFAALPTAGRTPAEVFLADPQAVIDLARDDAAANVPPEAPEDRHDG